jgi:DNA-binding winged helix-turn-helix (wHTH) protein
MCAGALIALQPQVFDLLEYAIRNRDRIVSKDDLLAAVWNGRIVSESTLNTRINAARSALGDSGEQQRLIRTSRAIADASSPAPAIVSSPTL